jgi:nitronate monooxygenase
MALDPELRAQLTLPAICAPMYRVSSPALVREACKGGLIGGLPRHNAGDFETFVAWLTQIRADLDAFAQSHPGARIGPIAVNLSRMPDDLLKPNLAACRAAGVEIIISAMGDPTELTQRAHDIGAIVFHDVTSLRFAEKAIAAGVDGLTCIGAGGGGHSGTISHLALVPKVRKMFGGVIVLAGAVSTGAAIRAAEILGADLSYLGTRFIATQESAAPQAYKELLVSQTAADLLYTHKVAGSAANWLKQSLRNVGLDPDALPEPVGKVGHSHLPEGIRPWFEVWSAGQGIELIDDIPDVATLITRLRREYIQACAVPDMADAARLAEQALAVD